MTQPDDRDAELIEAAVSTLRGLLLAVATRDRQRITDELVRLLTACVKYDAGRHSRPADAALVRAVEKLGA